MTLLFSSPPYQRNYEWTSATCKVFLEDVRKVANKNLNGERAEHFFGSIVYVVEDAGFGVPSKYVLTDGQQRVTTTMLFLMALRDTIQDSHYQETIQNQYIQNKSAAEGTEFKIKLKQVETDWQAYKKLALREPVDSALQTSRVYQNYSFFKQSLSSEPDSQLRNYLEKGLLKFEVITIQLEPASNPWENPQAIFESMNSLGQPLSLADLVRNYLLMGKSSDDQIDLYNKFWLKLEKQLPGMLSDFIRDWMQADKHRFFKVAKENNFKELYANFKDLVSSRDATEILESLTNFAKPYAQALGNETTGNNAIDTIISDFGIIGSSTAQSFITELLVEFAKDPGTLPKVRDLLNSLRTYMLRRRIIQVTKADNKFFPMLGAELPQFMTSNEPGSLFLKYVSERDYALRLPNDTEVTEQLQKMNFYSFGLNKSTSRLLLALLEENMTKSRPALDDENLQLEHIMPQTLNASWKAMLGENFKETHRNLLNNIGNITFIRHNQELGNKPFPEKRKTYVSKSGLQVTKNMVVKATTTNDADIYTWAADEITNRAQYLMGLLTNEVLPVPEKLKNSNNWKIEESVSSGFDSKKVLGQLIGETISYVINPQITCVVVPGAKVDFEGKVWTLSSLTKELKSRAGQTKASNAYQGAYYWTWGDEKLLNIEL